MGPVVLQLMIIALAAGGIALSSYIYRKKKASQVLVCPLKADCDTVIHSEFSKFFGVPIELLGIFYYSLIALSYSVFLFLPSLQSGVAAVVLYFATAGAFLFSLYLTFIQMFTIKQWCSWCLISATGSTAIFILALTGSYDMLEPLFAAFKPQLVGLHVLGVVFGLGGASIGDILFARFLKDWRISAGEVNLLSVMSQVVWFGLAVLVVTGFALFLSDVEAYTMSTKFQAKMTIVLVLIINGAFLNLYVTPRLMSIDFAGGHGRHEKKMLRARRVAFALGGISFVSWYSAFVLGLMRSVALPYLMIMFIYVALLGMALAGSQVAEFVVARRGRGAVRAPDTQA